MALNIISADERLREDAGIKGVILGKYKCGKTSLLWTLDPETTLFVDLEAGGLSVQGWRGDSIEVRDWSFAENLACFIGGPNPAKQPNEIYSHAHYQHVCSEFGDPARMDKYKTIFIDSITVAGRLCFQATKARPETVSETTQKQNLLAVYGLHGQTMIQWLTHIQHTKGKNIWFVGLLDEKKDDFGRVTYDPQMEGSKVGLELPGIVDQVITMASIPDENGNLYRAFVAKENNPFHFPAGDRSGKLNTIEKPHLGELMEKINRPHQAPISDGLTYNMPPTGE